MIKFPRKALTKIALPTSVVLMIVGFSAFHAQKFCDETIGAEIAPPPRYSTRFVLYPDRYIEGAADLGFKPGWVVTYAPRSKTYGTAFYVSFFGKMLARGTARIVTKQHMQAQAGIEQFQRRFAQLDAAVQVGTTFTSALTVLGEPILTTTNDDGSMSAYFDYTPREAGRIAIDWLTNGFTLLVSNGIVVRKGYSFTSSR